MGYSVRTRSTVEPPQRGSHGSMETTIAGAATGNGPLWPRGAVRGARARRGALADRYSFRGVEFPLFLFAIAATVWYAGPGPAIVTLVLSSVAFNYFFTEPFYTLYVTATDLPYYVVFLLFASLLAWFSAVRRRVERELLQSRDELAKEVAERTQQAHAFAPSTISSRIEPPSSRPSTRNWKPLPTPSRMTCARRFAISSGSPSSCRKARAGSQ